MWEGNFRIFEEIFLAAQIEAQHAHFKGINLLVPSISSNPPLFNGVGVAKNAFIADRFLSTKIRE